MCIKFYQVSTSNFTVHIEQEGAILKKYPEIFYYLPLLSFLFARLKYSSLRLFIEILVFARSKIIYNSYSNRYKTIFN